MKFEVVKAEFSFDKISLIDSSVGTRNIEEVSCSY